MLPVSKTFACVYYDVGPGFFSTVSVILLDISILEFIQFGRLLCGGLSFLGVQSTLYFRPILLLNKLRLILILLTCLKLQKNFFSTSP